MKRRIAVACVLVVVACGIGVAAAALSPLSAANLGSGNGTTSGCDSDGVSVSYTNAFDTTVADYRTSAVTVSTINAACSGKALTITIRDSSGSALWQGSTTVNATFMTLATTSITSSAIAGWAVSLTG